jgi:GTP cyclohydrolase I
MSADDNTALDLPDVAHHNPAPRAGALDWVGMDAIEVPLRLRGADGTPERVSARVDAHVSLERPQARGIHMSRLYLMVTQALGDEPLTPCLLRTLLRNFLASHADLSRRARVRIRYEQLVRRDALKSEHRGWRAYPVTISARMDENGFAVELATEIAYSSTCPASAALSRQLIQRQFARDFGPEAPLDRDAILAWLGSERGILATPHAQRSIARVRIRPTVAFGFDPVALIDRIEAALGTPVQTAVKREDEQAFALATGANLLFCEDAARRVQSALDEVDTITDFAVHVRHQESLHPHDAVASATKGIPGGYDAGTRFSP